MAGDDADAKAAVSAVIESAGMRAIDAGLLRRAHELEAIGFLHMTLQAGFGNTWSTAIKVLGA